MNEDKKFDVRLVERHIEQGLVTREEYRRYLEQLPDCGDNAVEFESPQPITVPIEEGD